MIATLHTGALSRTLRIAIAAIDPVRQADLAARVALSGHDVAEPGERADVVLADGYARVGRGRPVLRLTDRDDDGALPTTLTAAQLDAALRAIAVGLRVSMPVGGDGFCAEEAARPLLTPRELEILTCLGEGMSNKGVARKLGISAHTVKFHLEAVFAKLDATSRAEAVAKGLRRGLILL